MLSGKPTEREAFNKRIITRVVPIPQPEKTGRGQHTRLEIQNTEAGVVGHKCKGGGLSTSPHKARQDESGSFKGGAICGWTRSLYEGCFVGEGEFQAQDKRGEGLLALQGMKESSRQGVCGVVCYACVRRGGGEYVPGAGVSFKIIALSDATTALHAVTSSL